MCCKYKCQRAAALLVAQRKAGAATADGECKEKALPTFCHKVIKVHGQRDFDPARLVGSKRRNSVAAADIVEAYLIYGEFRAHERDSGFKDIRWVDLTDLVSNLTQRELKPLIDYEKKLEERMAAKKQKLLEAEEDE